MKIEFLILNTEYGKEGPTWHSRNKSIEMDSMNWFTEDMKNSTEGLTLDRIIINDAQIVTKKQVDDMIEFLMNAKKSFKR